MADLGIAHRPREEHAAYIGSRLPILKSDPRAIFTAAGKAQQAVIVRRIFAEYVGGRSPLAIVKELNREGVPAPRGGSWSASTLNGSRQRQNGILSNSLYVGRLTYNRQHFVKDPANGRRQARKNDRSQWMTAEIPELAIVETRWLRCQLHRRDQGSRGLFRVPEQAHMR